MKKKTFIQLHVTMILINCFFLIIVSAAIIVRIKYSLISDYTYKNLNKITTLILWYFSLLIVIWGGITYNRHWITFRENHIYVPSDWRIKNNRQQHRVMVRYHDIVDISFIRDTKSSTNKTIQVENLNPLYHQYMVLHLRNKRKEKIKIDWYSKKQKVKILEELKRRLEHCGNNVDLAQAQAMLKNLGMFGAKFAIDIAEKSDKKKAKAKSGKRTKK